MKSFIVTAALLLLLSVSGELLARPIQAGVLEAVDRARQMVVIDGRQYHLNGNVEIYRESSPDQALSPTDLRPGQRVILYYRVSGDATPEVGTVVISDK